MDEKHHAEVENSPPVPLAVAQSIRSHPRYADFETLSEAEHNARRRKLLRSIDLRLLPPLALIYLVSYLDKNALSQAKISGLKEDLNMHADDFNTATSIYFVGYGIFQPLSNGILTYLRPSWYISLAALSWGVVAATQSASQTYSGLVAARFILGIAESPVFPGCLFLMSSW